MADPRARAPFPDAPPSGGSPQRRSAEDEGSREEAAEAGLHAEQAENPPGQGRERHVTATDLMGPHPHAHHPADPNTGLVRMRLAPGSMLAGVLAAVVTIGLLAWLAYAVRGH